MSSKLDTSCEEKLIKAFRRSLADRDLESHSLLPLIDFLCQLARLSEVSCEAVLAGGVMDMFMNFYVTNFFDPLAEAEKGKFHLRLGFYAACNAFLMAVALSSRRGLDIICGHPLHILWSMQPFTALVQNRAEQRAKVWHSMRKELILWRIRSIYEMALDWTTTYSDTLLWDVCVDLLELSG